MTTICAQATKLFLAAFFLWPNCILHFFGSKPLHQQTCIFYLPPLRFGGIAPSLGLLFLMQTFRGGKQARHRGWDVSQQGVGWVGVGVRRDRPSPDSNGLARPTVLQIPASTNPFSSAWHLNPTSGRTLRIRMLQ